MKKKSNSQSSENCIQYILTIHWQLHNFSHSHLPTCPKFMFHPQPRLFRLRTNDPEEETKTSSSWFLATRKEKTKHTVCCATRPGGGSLLGHFFPVSLPVLAYPVQFPPRLTSQSPRQELSRGLCGRQGKEGVGEVPTHIIRWGPIHLSSLRSRLWE